MPIGVWAGPLPKRTLKQAADKGMLVDGRLRVKCNGGCGVTLELPVPDEGPSMWMARVSTGVMCDPCWLKADAAAERRAQSREMEGRLVQSGIPAELQGLRFEDMIRTGKRAEAVDQAVAWAEDPEARGLLLFGEKGTGKTRLAATAAFERVARGRVVRWVSVAALIQQLQAAFNDAGRADALRVLTGDGALVLDDLDKVNPSATVISQLYAAIDRRVTAGAALIVTTNMRPRQIGDMFGAPIASRLHGHCMGRMVEMDGPDRRLTLEEGA